MEIIPQYSNIIIFSHNLKIINNGFEIIAVKEDLNIKVLSIAADVIVLGRKNGLTTSFRFDGSNLNHIVDLVGKRIRPIRQIYTNEYAITVLYEKSKTDYSFYLWDMNQVLNRESINSIPIAKYGINENILSFVWINVTGILIAGIRSSDQTSELRIVNVKSLIYGKNDKVVELTIPTNYIHNISIDPLNTRLISTNKSCFCVWNVGFLNNTDNLGQKDGKPQLTLIGIYSLSQVFTTNELNILKLQSSSNSTSKNIKCDICRVKWNDQRPNLLAMLCSIMIVGSSDEKYHYLFIVNLSSVSNDEGTTIHVTRVMHERYFSGDQSIKDFAWWPTLNLRQNKEENPYSPTKLLVLFYDDDRKNHIEKSPNIVSIFYQGPYTPLDMHEKYVTKSLSINKDSSNVEHLKLQNIERLRFKPLNQLFSEDLCQEVLAPFKDISIFGNTINQNITKDFETKNNIEDERSNDCLSNVLKLLGWNLWNESNNDLFVENLIIGSDLLVCEFESNKEQQLCEDSNEISILSTIFMSFSLILFRDLCNNLREKNSNKDLPQNSNRMCTQTYFDQIFGQKKNETLITKLFGVLLNFQHFTITLQNVLLMCNSRVCTLQNLRASQKYVMKQFIDDLNKTGKHWNLNLSESNYEDKVSSMILAYNISLFAFMLEFWAKYLDLSISYTSDTPNLINDLIALLQSQNQNIHFIDEVGIMLILASIYPKENDQTIWDIYTQYLCESISLGALKPGIAIIRIMLDYQLSHSSVVDIELYSNAIIQLLSNYSNADTNVNTLLSAIIIGLNIETVISPSHFVGKNDKCAEQKQEDRNKERIDDGKNINYSKTFLGNNGDSKHDQYTGSKFNNKVSGPTKDIIISEVGSNIRTHPRFAHLIHCYRSWLNQCQEFETRIKLDIYINNQFPFNFKAPSPSPFVSCPFCGRPLRKKILDECSDKISPNDKSASNLKQKEIATTINIITDTNQDSLPVEIDNHTKDDKKGQSQKFGLAPETKGDPEPTNIFTNAINTMFEQSSNDPVENNVDRADKSDTPLVYSTESKNKKEISKISKDPKDEDVNQSLFATSWNRGGSKKPVPTINTKPGAIKEQQSPNLYCCDYCRKPLPRCAICLQRMVFTKPLNKEALKNEKPTNYTNIPITSHHSSNVKEANLTIADKPIDLENLNKWFCWCLSCHHGGHINHLEEWFEDHVECPVSGCLCACYYNF